MGTAIPKKDYEMGSVGRIQGRYRLLAGTEPLKKALAI